MLANMPNTGKPIELRIGYNDGYARRPNKAHKYLNEYEYNNGYELGLKDRKEDCGSENKS